MLDKKYNHQESEQKWQKYWSEKEIYKFRDDLEKSETFVIDTPPPTVSGLLHMGHVFSYCQADFVARFQRMQGKDVFYPIGFDDNGLPTERLVEKVIGKKAQIFERENGVGSFIAKCREIVDESEKEFEALFNSIALSVDWNQKYQTISPEVQKISQSSFVDLYKKGLIYQDFRPVIWDCVDQTALSQADLEDLEISSKANFINFESEDGDKIEIMTTRPELLPACVALLLNPNHFYAKKIGAQKEGATGKFAYSAVFQVKVPIIIDNDVKIDEENSESNITGAVMCCTFGDENDVKWVQKYNLEIRQIISDFGKMCEIKSDNHGDLYLSYEKGDAEIITTEFIDKNNFQNLGNFQKIYSEILASKKIKQAREDIIKFLEKEEVGSPRNSFELLAMTNGEDALINSSLRAQRGKEEIYLTRPSKEIKQVKKVAERSKGEIEYILKKQWFIKILPFKEQIKTQIEKCNWHPDFMKIRALQWCENLNSDWCISRQRFFGVPIPAWEVSDGTRITEIIVADFKDLPINPNDNSKENREKIFKIFERNGYVKKTSDDFKNDSKTEIKTSRRVVETRMSDWVLEKDDVNFYLKKDCKNYVATPETDILDTWATSSISPQISSKIVSEEILDELVKSGAISSEEAAKSKKRHEKLFPADLRPQAHEIIRTWAFYTIVKAYLHSLPSPLQENGSPRNESIAMTRVGEKSLAMTAEGESLTITNGKEKNGSPRDKSLEATNSKNESLAMTGNDEKNQQDNSIPWKNLMISGWCLAADKTKMSKSKGNVITPTALIQEKGSDIVRYWASNSNLGADTAYSEDVFKIGQKLLTKLFNAAKFMSMNFDLVEKYDCKNSSQYTNSIINQPADLWILSRLHQTIKQAELQFEKFEYCKAREKIEDFFWNDLCDNYLEIIKVRSYGLEAQKLQETVLNQEQKQEIQNQQLSAILTSKIVLNAILKLFSPFIPHICEEIYSTIFKQEFEETKSINSRRNWPKSENFFFNEKFIEIGEEILKVIFEVRKFKSDKNLSMKTEISKLEITSNIELESSKSDIANVSNALDIEIKKGKYQVKIVMN